MSTPAGPHEERLHALVACARDVLTASGADRWELFAKASSVRELCVSHDVPHQVLKADETGIAVRTFRAGRSGFATASGSDVQAARRVAEGALAAELEVPFDPLPPPHLLGAVDCPPTAPLPPPGWATHAAGELERALLATSDGQLELLRTAFQEGSFAWMLTTSDGFVANHSGTSASLLAELVVDRRRLGVTREWLHLPQPERFNPVAAAAQICDRALLTRAAEHSERGLRDVILHGEVTAQLLAALAPLFVATPAKSDCLPALLDRDGRLASIPLSLADDRQGAALPVTGPCDGEGLPASRTVLLEEGVPRHRLASYQDAVLCAETPRGGALRLSYRDYPATGFANLQVATANGLPAAELLGRTDRALYLLRPVTPPQVDPLADRYTLVASGVWLAGGRVKGFQPVVELGGSLGLMLRRIEAVGTDLRWYQTERGFVGAPSTLIRHQPVVG